jgi:phospholipid transport system substrate-binding protein
MLKTISALLLLGLLAVAPQVRADVEPDELARTTTSEVIRIVATDRDLKKGNSKKVYDLVEAKILPTSTSRR